MDQYIDINCDNIKKVEDAQGTPGKWQHNFKKCTERGCSALQTSYDFGSIMHYGPTLFGEVTITPKVTCNAETCRFGQRRALSEKDIKGLNELYGSDGNIQSRVFNNIFHILYSIIK